MANTYITPQKSYYEKTGLTKSLGFGNGFML